MVKPLGRRSLDILRDVAREVYRVVHPLLGSFESRMIVGSGFGGDETRYIDDAAEVAIVHYLERNHLSCVFVGEERGVQKIGDKPQFYLVTDAVDGTTNAVRGIDFVSASLAISPTDRLGSLEAAVVMDLFGGGIYEAEKGKGATYKSKKMKPTETTHLQEAVLSIDVSRSPETVENVIPLMKLVKSVRSLGSAALEICHVASGLLDAYVDVRNKLRTLDIAAGKLIIEEAGGVFLQPTGTGFDGVTLTEMNRFSVVAAANQEIYNEIVSLILRR